MLSNLLNGDLKVVDKDGNEKQDGNNAVTGDKIWITADGEVLSELIIVIKGDVTGDGALNSRDIAAIQKEIMEIEKLLGAYATAGDMNGDANVNSRDIAALQKKILN